MKQLQFIAVLIVLLCCSNLGLAYTPQEDAVTIENEQIAQFSEDFQDASDYILVPAADLVVKRVPVIVYHLVATENSQKNSREKSYFSYSYLIEPGLTLVDIVFPFHSFL